MTKLAKIKPVFRYSADERMVRLFRVLWTRGVVGDGDGYSVALSFALRPMLWHRKVGMFDWDVTVLGLRVHYKRAYGGVIT